MTNSRSEIYVGSHPRYSGIAIRCIAKDDDARTLNDITTMQEMTPKICENTPQYAINQKVYKLSDVRDGNEYNVTKLEDGRCWMTENISLLGEYTLTPADSDVSEIWTLPSSLTPSEITAEDFAIQSAQRTIQIRSTNTGLTILGAQLPQTLAIFPAAMLYRVFALKDGSYPHV